MDFLLPHFCAKSINCSQASSKGRLAESDLQHSLFLSSRSTKASFFPWLWMLRKSTLITDEILSQTLAVFISILRHGSHSCWVRRWLSALREMKPDYWQHLPGQWHLQWPQTLRVWVFCWRVLMQNLSFPAPAHTQQWGRIAVSHSSVSSSALWELRAKMLVEPFLAIFVFSSVFFYKIRVFPLHLAAFMYALYKASSEN